MLGTPCCAPANRERFGLAGSSAGALFLLLPLGAIAFAEPLPAPSMPIAIDVSRLEARYPRIEKGRGPDDPLAFAVRIPADWQDVSRKPERGANYTSLLPLGLWREPRSPPGEAAAIEVSCLLLPMERPTELWSEEAVARLGLRIAAQRVGTRLGAPDVDLVVLDGSGPDQRIGRIGVVRADDVLFLVMGSAPASRYEACAETLAAACLHFRPVGAAPPRAIAAFEDYTVVAPYEVRFPVPAGWIPRPVRDAPPGHGVFEMHSPDDGGARAGLRLHLAPAASGLEEAAAVRQELTAWASFGFAPASEAFRARPRIPAGGPGQFRLFRGETADGAAEVRTFSFPSHGRRVTVSAFGPARDAAPATARLARSAFDALLRGLSISSDFPSDPPRLWDRGKLPSLTGFLEAAYAPGVRRREQGEGELWRAWIRRADLASLRLVLHQVETLRRRDPEEALRYLQEALPELRFRRPEEATHWLDRLAGYLEACLARSG
ncbi:MAG: hypothetical protein HYZ53_29280 [Planctomycetes bacterium]|nr:hypothetical protein [Planctomycetota bacterium]